MHHVRRIMNDSSPGNGPSSRGCAGSEVPRHGSGICRSLRVVWMVSAQPGAMHWLTAESAKKYGIDYQPLSPPRAAPLAPASRPEQLPPPSPQKPPQVRVVEDLHLRTQPDPRAPDVLGPPNNRMPKGSLSSQDILAVQAAAYRLALEIIVMDAGAESEIEPAFAAAVGKRAAAVLVGSDALFLSLRERIAALGIRFAIPAITTTRESVAAGSLMSYGANVPDGYRQAGIYVGRILKGEKPADLPVVQPAKFELVINLKTAKALGPAIPESFLLRADEVIE
jgi:ABC transporter substrate binding protein